MFDLTLSFDNGPTPDVTPLVLDVLARRGVKSTFFVIGEKLAQPREPRARRARACRGALDRQSHLEPFASVRADGGRTPQCRSSTAPSRRSASLDAPPSSLSAVWTRRKSRQPPALAGRAGASRTRAGDHRAVERAAARLAGCRRLGRSRARSDRRAALEPDGAARSADRRDAPPRSVPRTGRRPRRAHPAGLPAGLPADDGRGAEAVDRYLAA